MRCFRLAYCIFSRLYSSYRRVCGGGGALPSSLTLPLDVRSDRSAGVCVLRFFRCHTKSNPDPNPPDPNPNPPSPRTFITHPKQNKSVAASTTSTLLGASSPSGDARRQTPARKANQKKCSPNQPVFLELQVRRNILTFLGASSPSDGARRQTLTKKRKIRKNKTAKNPAI